MKTCNQFTFIGFLTLLSIILMACTPRNFDRQTESDIEPSNVLNSVIVTQAENEGKFNSTINELYTVGFFELPPKINLIQHSNFALSFHPVRYARIWGWSADGRVAYSIEGGINSEASYQIDFVILDLITNNVLYNLIIHSGSANDWVEGEALFEVHGTSIENALRTHGIIEQMTDFLPFPMVRNDIMYYAQIIDIEHGEDEQWFLGDTILKYTLSIAANNGRKIIETFTPLLWLFDVDVCGYFLSPFENRILVVIAEDLGQHQHGGILYRFIGFHLGESFD